MSEAKDSLGSPQEQQAGLDILSPVLPNTDRPESCFTKVLPGSGSNSRCSSSKPQKEPLEAPTELVAPDKGTDGDNIDANESGQHDRRFHVLSADKNKALCIPSEFIETTSGSKNYLSRNRGTKEPSYALYLCKSFSTNASCAHGDRCDFIHSRHTFAEPRDGDLPVTVNLVHWSTPVALLEEAPYERHEPGSVFYINAGHSLRGGAANPVQVPSEQVYRTKGSEEAQHSDSTKYLRFCKHYERERCGRGSLCNFIHRVHLNTRSPQMPSQGHSMRSQRQQYNSAYRGGYGGGGGQGHLHPQQLQQMHRSHPHPHGGLSGHSQHMGGHPYQSRGGYRQQHQQAGSPHGGSSGYMTNNLPLHQQHAAGPVSFGSCGPMQQGRGPLVVPPGPSYKHHHNSFQQQQQQQQTHHHHHHHHHHPPHLQQQQSRVLNASQGYSFEPVYTSRPTSYTNNSPAEMPAMPLSPSSPYFTQRQQHPEASQLPGPEVSRQPVNQRSSASDYVISPLLLTYV
ncbi:Zinc finger protein [Trypanosoma brucei equiperdum]|uniref:Zinc finger protein n=1 Tax=Trypanosoma brucei equiperdum TaxID=630700 RepID=A0A3L6KYG7_9TRYP|nr:Zinc finger protein [Trypanosoma brucei equiperdum]